jgi:hypothetical protein
MIQKKAIQMVISSPIPLLKNFLKIGSVQFAVPQKICLRRIRVILLISAMILH